MKMQFLRFTDIKIPFLSLILLFLCNLSACATSSGKPPALTQGEITLHFIDVGQGDSIFISLPEGENLLIDTGSPSGGPELSRYLTSLGIKKINHLILTHPDDDHIGGIFNVISTVEVDHFYDNGFSNFRSTIYPDYVRLIRQDLSKYRILQAGEALLFKNITIQVLSPLLPPTGNSNNDSIVLRIMYGDIKILLTGDLGHIGERRLIDTGTELGGQILKVGHHGERDACSQDFLEHVRPEVAIISVGSGNIYARPHPEIVSRLEKSGSKVYRTDQDGSIIIRTDGQKYSVKTETDRDFSQKIKSFHRSQQ
ncbi:MBL fold metallo-hydrolase [bacterium]|nr:MAG: MBL fold metallo-hydrolase [bacterium]